MKSKAPSFLTEQYLNGNESLESRKVPLPRRFHGANFWTGGSFISQKVSEKTMNKMTFLTTRNWLNHCVYSHIHSIQSTKTKKKENIPYIISHTNERKRRWNVKEFGKEKKKVEIKARNHVGRVGFSIFKLKWNFLDGVLLTSTVPWARMAVHCLAKYLVKYYYLVIYIFFNSILP